MTLAAVDSNSKRCVAASIVLCIAQIMTVVATDYQVYAIDKFSIDDFFDINHAIFLSPLIILVLARNLCVIIGLYAVPILICFVLRSYDFLQFFWFGINSMAVQKGDGTGFLTMVFEMLSSVIAVTTLLAIVLVRLIARGRGA